MFSRASQYTINLVLQNYVIRLYRIDTIYTKTLHTGLLKIAKQTYCRKAIQTVFGYRTDCNRSIFRMVNPLKYCQLSQFRGRKNYHALCFQESLSDHYFHQR